MSVFRHLVRATAAITLLASAPHAWFVPYWEPDRYLKATSSELIINNLRARLPDVWNHWKIQFLRDGVIQGTRPDGTAAIISEGQAFGLVLSVWMNDQATFNTIWQATENRFWNSNSGWYRWTPGDDNFAGDADIDIAGALIMASALVDSGLWVNHRVNNQTYKEKARIVLASVWTNFVRGSGLRRYIQSWPNAGEGIVNPSYHMPHWFTTFAAFNQREGITGQDWLGLRDAAYRFLAAQPNASRGLARNFSNLDGGGPSGGTSSPNNFDMGFDAIRVPWRWGLDASWHRSPQSIALCNSMIQAGLVQADRPGMYSVGGSGALIGWEENDYERPMTRAMWLGLANGCAATNPAAQTWAATILSGLGGQIRVLETGRRYFAEFDDNPAEDYFPSRNYYAQTLALMGTLSAIGSAPDVYRDIRFGLAGRTPPDTATADTTLRLISPLAVSSDTLQWDALNPISFTFSRAVSWSLAIRGHSSGHTWTRTGASSGGFTWRPSRTPSNPSPFRSGERVTMTLTVPGWTPRAGTNIIQAVLQDTARGAAASGAIRSIGGPRVAGNRITWAKLPADAGLVNLDLRDASGSRVLVATLVPVPGIDGVMTVTLPSQLPTGLLIASLRAGDHEGTVRFFHQP